MRLRPRQSGMSTFTLERPTAMFRDAQSSVVERVVPWLARIRHVLSERVGTAADSSAAWAMRAAAYIRETAANLRERSGPWLVQTHALLRERLTSARDVIVPRVANGYDRVRENTRVLAVTAAPRLTAARERLEERTVTTFDSLRPWLTRAGKRMDAFRENASAKRKAGVPIWAAALMVIVAALVAQALAHKSVERRHELETRQLTQIHRIEQAQAQARAADAVARENDDVIRMLGSTIAWTISNALGRKNGIELDSYFHELTKNEQIDLVVLADTKGKVMVASDPGLRGAEFSQHFPSTLLQEATISIHRGSGITNRLVTPVQRYGQRLGTAVVVYKAR
jgi:hypothetical protein